MLRRSWPAALPIDDVEEEPLQAEVGSRQEDHHDEDAKDDDEGGLAAVVERRPCHLLHLEFGVDQQVADLGRVQEAPARVGEGREDEGPDQEARRQREGEDRDRLAEEVPAREFVALQPEEEAAAGQKGERRERPECGPSRVDALVRSILEHRLLSVPTSPGPRTTAPACSPESLARHAPPKLAAKGGERRVGLFAFLFVDAVTTAELAVLLQLELVRVLRVLLGPVVPVPAL